MQLTGEAYFEVTKDAAHPFIVQTGEIEVEVLGTHFNVVAYDDNEQYRATLLEGRVRVSNAHFQAELQPGEQLVYTTTTGRTEKSACDADASIAWIDGRMDYSHIPMGELMGRLSRIYGRDIEITDANKKLQDVHFVMNDTLPLSDIMEAFAITYHLNIHRTANGYTIE